MGGFAVHYPRLINCDRRPLAREPGHGVHQMLAAKNGALMAPTPPTLVEIARLFGEMLTFKRLLAQTKSVKQRNPAAEVS